MLLVDKLISMEKEFESMCYGVVKLNNKKNGGNLSKQEVMNYSVYAFYKLKEQLLADKAQVN